MRIPRDLSGAELVKALGSLGYTRANQERSHIRLTTERGGLHHVTVPDHHPLKLGTLAGLLKSIAAHHRLTMEELVRRLDL